MPLHYNCHCKHCSTSPNKRGKGQYPQPQPQPTRQTVRVFDITTRDILPCLKIPARLFTKVKSVKMPAWIRLEKCQTTQEYERGWDYVERRHGRLVMVRNKKDSRDIHHGGWKTTKPNERAVKEYVLLEKVNERLSPERIVQPGDAKVFINVNTPRNVRRGSPDSDDRTWPVPQPRIQVRRPLHASPSSPSWEMRESQAVRPHHYYVDAAHARLVKKVPVEKVQLQRVRPMEIIEVDTYCEDDNDNYDEMLQDFDMPIREPRPYHIPDPENSVWDNDHQAWMVQRKPRVRFE